MPTPARPEPAESAPCRTCGKPLPAGKAACPACGAAHGEGNRCPHCRVVADVEAHPALGFRCLVCGGPRLAFDLDGVGLGDESERALREAGRQQAQHAMFSAGGLALVGMGALAVLVAGVVVLAASPGVAPAFAAFLASLVPLSAGLWALRRAARARAARGSALQRARVAALADVQAATGSLEAARVAEIMRLSPEASELLLAEASVATFLNEAPAPRLRVDEPRARSPQPEPEAPEGESEPDAERARRADGERGS